MSDFVPGYGVPDPQRRSALLAFAGQDLLIDEGGEPPGAEALAPLGPCTEALVIGHLDGEPCVMQVWPAAETLPPGLVRGDYRRLWGKWPQGRLEAMSRARQLAAWLHSNRYCGACGQAMTTRTNEPARECPSCGFLAYPRISPVCVGLVVKGSQMLLARSPHFPPGIYSALAGFLEAGESAEECLRREIREEAGIEIRNIRWFGSQSWPYPHSLMMGFFADYESGELQAQAGEIEDIGWFEPDRLPKLPHPSTIAYQMIQHLLQSRPE